MHFYETTPTCEWVTCKGFCFLALAPFSRLKLSFSSLGTARIPQLVVGNSFPQSQYILSLDIIYPQTPLIELPVLLEFIDGKMQDLMMGS